MSSASGTVVGVNGNLVAVEFEGAVRQNEVGYVYLRDQRLKSEVIRMQHNVAEMQVFESTKGLGPGDSVEFTGELLTVELGPGLLGQIFDGLQNPLPQLAEEHGVFLPKGVYASALDRGRQWEFQPVAEEGSSVRAGSVLGMVREGLFDHKIMVPFDFADQGTVSWITDSPAVRVDDRVAVIEHGKGHSIDLTSTFRWPAKIPINCFAERLMPTEPMITGTRIIDTLFPVARGGTYCIPGPFGAGKTVLQQVTSRFAAVDVVIIAACGERAGEVVETMREFPELTDPRTGRTLMERTIIICNTSSMPVAAREASIYTAVTLAEYYRQMGLHVLMLADSTSRWAQALR
jgi:V/A-type H+-transporting ATPase subunit A